jgi:PAS domain S-box-containing protein
MEEDIQHKKKEIWVIEPDASQRELACVVREALGTEGWSIQMAPAAEELLENPVPERDQLVVIGSQVPDLVKSASQVYQRLPKARFILIVPAEREKVIWKELTQYPRIGERWSVARPDAESLKREIQGAIRLIEQQTHFRTALNRARLTLTSKPQGTGLVKRRQHISPRLHEAVVQQASDAVIATDLQGDILTWNLGAEKLFRIEAAKALSRPIQSIAKGGWAEKILRSLEVVRSGKTVQSQRIYFLSHEGTHLAGEMSIILILDEENKPFLFSIVVHDIGIRLLLDRKEQALVLSKARARAEHKRMIDLQTNQVVLLNIMEDLTIRRKELEEVQKAGLNIMEDLEQQRQSLLAREKKLKETQGMLIQAGKLTAMGQLGAGIAHELNQPIAAMIGFAQHVLDQIPDDHPMVPNIRLIEKQGQRVAKIVENVRLFSRADQWEPMPVILNEAVEDALLMIKGQLRYQGIVTELQLDPQLPPVMADRHKMQQIIINLLLNARDAILENGQRGQITIRTQVTGERWVEIRITDTGAGISKETQEQMFNPFFTTKPPNQGTGLGLSITYGIVKDHKGVIDVESTLGQGTTFIIKIPVVSTKTKSEFQQARRKTG